jgi:hypothetical protein
MNAATASEIARLETMTITKLVDRFESTLKTTSRAIMLTYLRKALFQRSRRASSWMNLCNLQSKSLQGPTALAKQPLQIRFCNRSPSAVSF